MIKSLSLSLSLALAVCVCGLIAYVLDSDLEVSKFNL